MKLIDKHAKAVLELSYDEAETLFIIAYNYDGSDIEERVMEHLKTKEQINEYKKQKRKFNKTRKMLIEKLDEYINT